MIAQRPTLAPFGDVYFRVPAEDALRYVNFRCELVVDLIERASLPPQTRLELGTNWRYVQQVAKHITLRWSRLALERKGADSDTLHLHYVLLPQLLTEHIPMTGKKLLRHCPESHIQDMWGRIWSNVQAVYPYRKAG